MFFYATNCFSFPFYSLVRGLLGILTPLKAVEKEETISKSIPRRDSLRKSETADRGQHRKDGDGRPIGDKLSESSVDAIAPEGSKAT
jgi:hypothetical protein